MKKVLFKRDMRLQNTAECEKCHRHIPYPIGSQVGDFVMCAHCGNRQELRNAVEVLCPHCFRRVCGREEVVDNEFKCPVCGVTYVLAWNLDLVDGETLSMLKKYYEGTIVNVGGEGLSPLTE